MKRFLQVLFYLLGVHIAGLFMLTLFRVVQFTALHSMIADPSIAVWPAFVRGVLFDNVVGCYVMALPLVVLLGAACMGCYARRLRQVAEWWFGVTYSLLFLASAANVPYFAYFFKPLNSSIFQWFSYAGTTAGMVLEERSYYGYMVLFLVSVALFIFFLHRFRRYIDRRIACLENVEKDGLTSKKGSLFLRVTLFIVCAFLCVVGIRGGLWYKKPPIKTGKAYYCTDAMLNQLGINPAFSLLSSAVEDMKAANRELHFMPYPEAVENVRRSLGITGRADSARVLLRTVKSDTVMSRHNVVVIMMESMSANYMQTFGQKLRITPALDNLAKSSLFFPNFYSAGTHTNLGLCGTLYSLPAIMSHSVMKGAVTRHRQGLSTVLKDKGWHTMFFLAHEGQYDNMEAFMRTNGYEDFYSREDYPASAVVNRWGVSDHFLFDYALQTMDRESSKRKPFFATILTISNHPPFAIPEQFKSQSSDPRLRAVEYADWCIGDFLSKAKRKPWYNNTVFVLLGDHGQVVGKTDSELPQSYNHVPLMVFGPGVKNGVYDGLSGQVDVMPTVLGLLNASYDYEGFGVDLLKKRRKMIYYAADNQIVSRSDKQVYIYEPATKKSFCYDVTPNWGLKLTRPSQVFTPLRSYAFSEIQTAEFVQRRQQ